LSWSGSSCYGRRESSDATFLNIRALVLTMENGPENGVPQPPVQKPILASPNDLDWLLRPKPALLLLALKSEGEWNISSLSRKSSMSYVHAIGLLKRLEELGFVLTESKGNRRLVRLTDSGSAFASALEELLAKAGERKVLTCTLGDTK
jgi:predicted transcriptional regulator